MNEGRDTRVAAFSQVDLYPVTGQALSDGRGTEQIVSELMAAGCKVVQLREKDLCKRDYYQLALRVRRLSAEALLICNDHLDVALAVGADGVHLGTDDLPIEEARKLAPNLIIGASSHNLDQALSAQRAGADYVNIGPIFATATKTDTTAPVGPQAISAIAPRLDIPFTVMGGIKMENIDQVLANGARHVAVVTAVTAAGDVKVAARELRQRILAAGPEPMPA